MLVRVWRKGNPPALLVGMQTGIVTMENSMEGPQKTENRVVLRPSNLIPGHISGENSNSKRYMHPSVHSSTIYNSLDMEAILMPIDKGMNKENFIYICIYIFHWSITQP